MVHGLEGDEAALEEPSEGVQAYASRPITRITAPATKPFGRGVATPRYGKGRVKKYTDIGTAKSNQHVWYKCAKYKRANIAMNHRRVIKSA